MLLGLGFRVKTIGWPLLSIIHKAAVVIARLWGAASGSHAKLEVQLPPTAQSKEAAALFTGSHCHFRCCRYRCFCCCCCCRGCSPPQLINGRVTMKFVMQIEPVCDYRYALNPYKPLYQTHLV
jgi:hypothetical protein